ncbi:ankyrin repeat domain-containing protein [Candidatus Dependentiae bacterium]|nr:ankyrin repeat domain-containing protein [Candidatus Dependentiae bacterium]
MKKLIFILSFLPAQLCAMHTLGYFICKAHHTLLPLSLQNQKLLNLQAVEAAKSGNSTELQDLLNAGASQDIVSTHGHTGLLGDAAFRGFTQIVKLLLNAKVNPNTIDKVGYTPLCWSIIRGYENIVKLLLAANADPNLAIEDDATPLYHAITEGRTYSVKLLVIANAKLNKATKDGQIPLYWAIKRGNLETIQFLLTVHVCKNLAHKYYPKDLFSTYLRNPKDFVKFLLNSYKAYCIKFREPIHFLTEKSTLVLIETAIRFDDNSITYREIQVEHPSFKVVITLVNRGYTDLVKKVIQQLKPNLDQIRQLDIIAQQQYKHAQDANYKDIHKILVGYIIEHAKNAKAVTELAQSISKPIPQDVAKLIATYIL